jgi:hypothetical protein
VKVLTQNHIATNQKDLPIFKSEFRQLLKTLWHCGNILIYILFFRKKVIKKGFNRGFFLPQKLPQNVTKTPFGTKI